MEVRGRDLIAGLPRTIPITSSEVMEAIEAPAPAARGRRPDRARADAAGALVGHHRQGHGDVGRRPLLRNIDKLLTQVTGVPCHVAENPLNCVALGTGLALEHFDFFKKSLVQLV